MSWGQVAGALAGPLIGLAMEGHEDRRQMRQQKKLNKLQIKGQKEMGTFNKGLAMDMWNETNYEAQREHMENAGLNVGLMYGMGGGGGVTSNAGGSGSVQGSQAAQPQQEVGMGLQLGLQAAMQQAQIELTKAATEKTKTETNKLAGVDTEEKEAAIDEKRSSIEAIQQSVKNEKLKEAILEYQKDMARIERDIKEQTEMEVVNSVRREAEKLFGEAKSALAKGAVDNKTYQEQIKQIEQATTEQSLRIAAQKKNMQLTDEQMKKIATEINIAKQANMRAWDQMSQEDRARIAKKIADDNQGGGLLQELITLIGWY